MATRLTMVTPIGVLGVLVVLIHQTGSVRQAALEIGYSKLKPPVYHPSGSNIIYGESQLSLTLGCLLPEGKDPEKERRGLKWRKDDLNICDTPSLRHKCRWEDRMFERGAVVLVDVLLDEYDDPSHGKLGSGTYTCYHSQDGAIPDSARVWVAGKYLEITVNNITSANRTHQLPTDGNEKSFILDCKIGAGLRSFEPHIQVKWYRDANLLTTTSDRYIFTNNGRRLVIKDANGKDEGVYMCEAQINSPNHLKSSLQYVILHGTDTSSASTTSTISGTWRRILFWLVYAFIFSAVYTFSPTNH